MALSSPEPARQRGLASGGESSGVGAEPGGVRRWHATWRPCGGEGCDWALMTRVKGPVGLEREGLMSDEVDE